MSIAYSKTYYSYLRAINRAVYGEDVLFITTSDLINANYFGLCYVVPVSVVVKYGRIKPILYFINGGRITVKSYGEKIPLNIHVRNCLARIFRRYGKAAETRRRRNRYNRCINSFIYDVYDDIKKH